MWDTIALFSECPTTSIQGSSQDILVCRAGTRAPPAGTHETKKKIYFLFLKFFHVLCMYLSSKHAEMHFCFPFIEGKCLFLTLH
jgi:hypothetical protein